MGGYIQTFIDSQGLNDKMHFNANSDADAIALCNDFAAKSDASWTSLQAVSDLAVDAGTYPNYADAAKPVAGITVRQQGELIYGVQSPQQHLIVSIPAVDPTYLSPIIKTAATDPGVGVGKLVDEEGVAVSVFIKGKYRWRKRKGL